MKGSEEEDEGSGDEDGDFSAIKQQLKANSSNNWKNALFEGGGDVEAANMKYSDMFDPPNALKVSADEDEEDEDDDNSAKGGDKDEGDDEEDVASPTFFQQKQQKIQKQIDKLEAEAVAEKNWALKGEIEAGSRPHNALLDVHLEYDTASKAIPIITEEVTESIEDIIRRRILNDERDDVERKEEVVAKPRKEAELSTEKSKKGLGELYEADYLEKMYSAGKEAELSTEKSKK